MILNASANSGSGGVKVSLCLRISNPPQYLPRSISYLLEERQQTAKPPALIPEVIPGIIITGSTAVKRHPIEHGATADDLSGGNGHDTVVNRAARNGLVLPVVLGVSGGPSVARDADGVFVLITAAVSISIVMGEVGGTNRVPASITRTLTVCTISCGLTCGR